MATVPASGPAASGSSVKRQPTTPAAMATRRMLAIVTANPSASWSVRAEPA
jgi:hypothetical protein